MKNQAITLGRIGILIPIAAILLFWVPVIGQLLGIVPIVLLLISHHKFSKVYENPVIFKKMLTGVIVFVVGAIIGGIILAIAVSTAALTMSAHDPETMGLSQLTDVLFQSGLSIFAAIIILAASIIGAYLIFQSLKALAEKSGINYFKTAGLLYFIGAIGVIVFFLGSIVAFVGWIIHIVAYFSIKPDKEAVVEEG